MTIDASKPIIQLGSEHRVEPQSWGNLLWGTSRELGNSETLTVGWCLIEEGEANGLHYHPNCDEVLVVVEGRVRHSWNGQQAEMSAGDLISIPAGVVHNAENVGSGQARLLICFSSADRETVGVEE